LHKIKEYRLSRVIVCSPQSEYFHMDNLDKHNIKETPNKGKTKFQHSKLKSTLSNFGAEVLDVPELEGHPNSIFTRDTALCTHKGYIKLRMGLETRRGEEDWMAKILNSLKIPCLGSIRSPGTVEGGDIILTDSVAFVGYSQRTNKEGIKQIAKLLKKIGYEIRIIDVPSPFLHLGGLMSIIGADSILYCKGIFPESFLNGFNRIKIQCNSFIGGNVIYIKDKEIIVDSANIKSLEILKKAKYNLHPVNLSEFIKETGGPTCLILPI